MLVQKLILFDPLCFKLIIKHLHRNILMSDSIKLIPRNKFIFQLCYFLFEIIYLGDLIFFGNKLS